MKKRTVYIYGVEKVNVTKNGLSKPRIAEDQCNLHMSAGQADVIVQMPVIAAKSLVSDLNDLLRQEAQDG